MTAKKPPVQGPLYEPTESQIAAETALIRADWTPEERRRRARGKGKYERDESVRMGKFVEIEVGRPIRE